MARQEAPDSMVELTDRALQVMRLLAEGLSSAQIGQRLVLSEKTGKGYISNITSKLHLADRTQAAIFAWWEGRMHRGEP